MIINMKKFYYLIAMAIMAFTFTSCEDVPAPFGQPVHISGDTEGAHSPAVRTFPHRSASLFIFLATPKAKVDQHPNMELLMLL